MIRKTSEALHAWKNGDYVQSISLGGLGDGYEVAIHQAAFDMIDSLMGEDLKDPYEDQDALRDRFYDALAEHENEHGYSGAQVGAAIQLAYKALTMGWEDMVNTIPVDRAISISKHGVEGES